MQVRRGRSPSPCDDRNTKQLGLGRVRDLVPGIDGRFRLDVSCVRQRCDDEGVGQPTVSIPLCTPRSKCSGSESHRSSEADASRLVLRASVLASRSPNLRGLMGWSDCLYRQVMQLGSSDEIVALGALAVARRSLPGSPGTTAAPFAPFRERRLRRKSHSSRQVVWYVRWPQSVEWSSVSRGESFPMLVSGPCERRRVGWHAGEFGPGDSTATTATWSVVRTRPLTRVRHEKRNVDQRPPTGGEPDRHS